MGKPFTFKFCLLVLVLLIIKLNLCAQGEVSQWFLYNKQHYSFKKNGFTVQPNVPISVDRPLTSVSDSTGNLLLLAANGVIYDRNYAKLPFYTKQHQQKIIYGSNVYLVKKPGSALQYYLFYPARMFNNNTSLFGVYYALVDLSLNNGYGDIVIYDSLIADYTSRGFTVISAGDNDDFWVITHKQNSNNFSSWRVTANGLNTIPVKSIAGMDVNTKEYDYPHLKASPNGKFIAGVPSYYYAGQFPFFRRFVELYDFDATTGLVSTHVKSYDDGDVGGADDDIEFSADSRLLYVKFDYYSYGLQPCGFAGGNMWQYNTCYRDSASFSKYTYYIANVFSFCSYYLWGNVQLAPDKKIYFLYSGTPNGMNIPNPNVIGRSSGYQFSTPNFKYESSIGLPTFYQGYLNKAVQNNIVYSGGCYPNPVHFSITNNSLQQVQWNFNDVASGANNTSVLLKPSHTFSLPGIYKVSAILYDKSAVPFDTIYNTIEIKDPSKRLLPGLPKDTSMCAGQKFWVGLNAINGIFYWQKRYKGYLSDLQCSDSLQIGDYGDGTYIVEMHQNDCDGCILTDSITFHTLKTPDIYLGDNASFCTDDSVQLYTYNPGAKTIWNTGDTTQIIWAKQPGVYWVQAEYNHNGCIVRDSIKIKANPPVKFSLPPDTTLCNSSTLLLDPQVKNAYYRWQDNSTQNNYLVTKPDNYWVTITNYDGCRASDTINVSYVSGDAVYLGNDTSLCRGDSLLLQSNVNNATYLWSNGVTADSIYVKQTGSYWVKVSNGSCAVSDTIHVVFNNKPVFSLGADTSLCENESLVLTPGLNGDYIWQDGSTTNNYTVQHSGLYSAQITQNGCSSADSININFMPLPVVNLGNDTGFCNGQSLLLNAYNNNISTYQWQNNSTQPQYLVTQSGTYYVNAIANNGCLSSDTINITVTQPPAFSLGSDTVLCDKQMLTYEFNITDASYLWNDGSTTNRYTINQSGNYSLMILKDGCSSKDDINVTYKPAPQVNLGNDTSLCAGNMFTLSVYNAGANYLWQDNSSQPAYTVTKQGNYFVQVNLDGCKQSDTIHIIYNTAPVFSLGNDTSICLGQTILLEPKVSGDVNYLWQDGNTSGQYTVAAPGTYSLKVTNNCGSSVDDIRVSSSICLLEMPNAFTPNNDGLNDIFRVKYPAFIKQFNMVIYNRWGTKIFETKDPNKGWDGNINSLPQQQGSYTWIIKLTDYNNKVQVAHGMVTLLR